MQNKQFLVISQPIAAALRIGNFFAWKFLAATTAVLAYAMLHEFLSAHLDGQNLNIATTAGVIGIYFLVDAGLTQLLRFAFKTRRNPAANKYQKAFGHFVVLLIVLKVIATMTTSIWAAPEMADALTSNQGEESAINALLITDSLQHASKNIAQIRLSELEKTEHNRINLAKNEAQRIVSEAVNSGNKWQKKSYHSIGFAWLQSPKNPDKSDHQYAARIQAAQQKAAQLVDAERQRTIEAAGNVQAIQTDSSYQRTATLLAEKAAFERQQYETKRSRRRGYIWLADILAGVFGIYFTYLLTLREKAAGIEEKEKTVSSVISAATDKAYSSFVNFLENIFNVDINGDGTIGGADTSAMEPPLEQSENLGFYAIKNRAKHQTETPVSTPPPPPVSRKLKTAETIVAQETQPVSQQPKQVKETVIVTAPQEDVSKWKKYASIYYKRSHTSATMDTRNNNWERYQEYKELLINAGISIEEGETLTFK